MNLFMYIWETELLKWLTCTKISKVVHITIQNVFFLKTNNVKLEITEHLSPLLLYFYKTLGEKKENPWIFWKAMLLQTEVPLL